MIYRSIFLSALLVPVAIAHSNTNIEIQREKLQEELFQKELALSKIGKEIDAQEKLLDIMWNDLLTALSNTFESLNEQEKKMVKEKLKSFEDRFEIALSGANLDNFLVNEFFNDTTSNNEQIERVKSLMVRRVIEQEILKHLVENYENNLQIVAELHLALTKSA
jgi:hypothetical protein